MARRRKGRPVHGWINLDKPFGMASTRAVSATRRVFDAQKAGHSGTLDPLATGVLPIALGEATKTAPYVVEGRKTYRFTIRWGEERTTDDAEGEATETSAVRPEPDAIAACLPQFIGETMQVPPAFSAIKINGERAYARARDGASIELTPRPIRIDDLTLAEAPDADHAVIEAHCGKGAYMRALARDIARALGARGHISALRRTRVGPFDESDAISLESLETLGHSAGASEALLPVESGLDGIPAMSLSEFEANRLRCGQPVSLLKRADLMRYLDLDSQGQREDGLIYAVAGGKPVAIVRLDTGRLHPVRVLNL